MTQKESKDTNKEDQERILKLQTPILNFGKEIDELNYSGEITGKMFRDFGMPFKFSSSGEVEVDTEAGAEYVEAVCGLEAGGFDKLRGKDCLQACMKLLVFFQ